MKKSVVSQRNRCKLHIARCLVLACVVTISASANVITVTNTNDSGQGSLRQALVDANDGDTVNFDCSLQNQTIILTSAELAIDKNVTITGPGPDMLAVSGSFSTFRVLHV